MNILDKIPFNGLKTVLGVLLLGAVPIASFFGVILPAEVIVPIAKVLLGVGFAHKIDKLIAALSGK